MLRRILLPGFLVVSCLLPARGQSRIEHRTLHSDLLRSDKSYTVYLPDGYDAGDAAYPVLYLLHGAFGCDRNWVEKGDLQRTADSLIRSGLIRPAVIVMPDARGADTDMAGAHMGYFDQPGWPYERFFFEEFLPEMERSSRLLPGKENRAIAGLSMGGGGAVAYAQRHPGCFGAVVSLSGLLDAFPGGEPSRAMPEVFLASVAGTSPVGFLRRADKSALETLRTVRWYADCGDRDFLAPVNVGFYLLMREKEVPLEYRMRAGGHDWSYWRSALPEVLIFLFGK